jgi:hypothetical protein
MDDDNRTGGEAHTAFADRAEEQRVKPSHASATDYQEIGALGGVEQYGCRGAFDHFGVDDDVGTSTEDRCNRLVETAASFVHWVRRGKLRDDPERGRELRIEPAGDHMELSPAEPCLPGSPAKSVQRLFRAVDTDDDPRRGSAGLRHEMSLLDGIRLVTTGTSRARWHGARSASVLQASTGTG